MYRGTFMDGYEKLSLLFPDRNKDWDKTHFYTATCTPQPFPTRKEKEMSEWEIKNKQKWEGRF